MLLSFISTVKDIVPWLVPVLLGVGLIFCIVEAIIPGFGFFGISGIVLSTGGVVFFGIAFYDRPWLVAILIGVVVFAILLMFLFIVKAAKTAKRGGIFENKTALPVDYDLESMLSNSKYINKFGKTITDLHPVGKIRINDDVVEVYAKTGVILKNNIVKVIEVDDDKIFVEMVEN